MNAYFDPSYIVGVVLGDAHWATLDLSSDTPVQRWFSDFGFGEVVSAMAARARGWRMDKSGLASRIDDAELFLADWHKAEIDRNDLAIALRFVSDPKLAIRFPDAIHIAIAGRIGATLYTGDRQQHHAALALGLRSINPLAAQDSA